MKIIPILLILFITGHVSHAQKQKCNYNLTCTVLAPSGLTLRASPSLKAKAITWAPHKASLKACEETVGKLLVEGIEGHWRPVSYKGNLGYMFDGFLEITRIGAKVVLQNSNNLAPEETYAVAVDGSVKAPPSTELEKTTIPSATKAPAAEEPKLSKKHPYLSSATEVQLVTELYNYCGDVKKLDPGLLWYGFYPAKEGSNNGPLAVEPVVLNIMLSKSRTGDDLQFDLSTQNNKSSLFLLGFNRKLDYEPLKLRDNTTALRLRGPKVFPGQEIGLTANNLVKLGATGIVTQSGSCPQIENYQLTVYSSLKGRTVQQNILSLLPSPDSCTMPEIYWYGDFTGDQIPEIILVSTYAEKNIFTLLTSRTNSALYKKEAQFIVPNCK
jgi:hypothetical protein